MQPEISELIVLQIIYTLLVLQNQHATVTSGKVSLVRLTNEIQNNVLVNQMVDRGEDKLDINDILVIVKRVFPNQRISLVDGQLSFQNVQVAELQQSIQDRLRRFTQSQHASISKLEDEILNPQRRATTTTPAQGSHIDPKREKLLQLYRDTVLNKLRAKSSTTTDLPSLYRALAASGDLARCVRHVIAVDRLTNDTPSSVHDLQLVLQRSICDGLMSCSPGSPACSAARQLQLDLDDTVQFMRRALE